MQLIWLTYVFIRFHNPKISELSETAKIDQKNGSETSKIRHNFGYNETSPSGHFLIFHVFFFHVILIAHQEHGSGTSLLSTPLKYCTHVDLLASLG